MSAKQEIVREFDKLMASPVTPALVVGEDLATKAAEVFSKWRPYDTRWYVSQHPGSGHSFDPSSVSKRVMRFSKVEVTGIDRGVFEVGLFMDANMKEFEDYDAKVVRSWKGAASFHVDEDGLLVDLGGTKHGGVARTLPDPSPHLIRTGFDAGRDDELVCDKPVSDWRLKAVVKVEVSLEGDGFLFCYSARGNLGVLAEGVITGTDLVRMTRTLIHRLFGHKDASMKVGDFLDGYRQLLSGEKRTSGALVSEPEKWAQRGDAFMSIGKVALICGILVELAGIAQHGWNAGWLYHFASILIIVAGQVASSIMVPITEAKEKELASKSFR
jgi:hypothetical protein